MCAAVEKKLFLLRRDMFEVQAKPACCLLAAQTKSIYYPRRRLA
ncbi:MAG: hypothetical protein ACK51L_04345 [bacterium]